MSRTIRRTRPRSRRSRSFERVYIRAKTSAGGDDHEEDPGADHEPSKPVGSRNGLKAHRQEQDECDHVADAIERDAAERPSSRHGRLPTQPSGAQHLADANGQHVVACEAAEHHLVEPPKPHVRRRRDLAPAGRLDEVADHERERCEQDELDLGVRQRSTHGVGVRVTNREPEEDRADREAAEGDEHPAACHREARCGLGARTDGGLHTAHRRRLDRHPGVKPARQSSQRRCLVHALIRTHP